MHSSPLRILALAAVFTAPVGAAPQGLLTLRGPGAQIGATFRDPSAGSTPRRAGGAVVILIAEGSPAAMSGIRAGDLVTVFDDLEVRNSKDLSRLVAETPPGRTVNVTIIREGRPRVLEVTPVLER